MKKFPKKTIKIKLGDFEGWLLSHTGGVGRAIAPLEHCDENGEVIEFFATSYAHFYPESDSIRRFGEKIGTSKDIIILKQ